MADINNLNSGDSSSSYNAYNYGNNVNNVPKVNAGGEYSHNWKRAPRPFGLNVRVPQTRLVGVRTETLIKEIVKELAFAPIKSVIDYFKDNENVFNGNVSAEIESIMKQQKMTVELLQDADDSVMSSVPTFMIDM